HNMGDTAQALSDPQALAYYRESLSLFAELGDRNCLAFSLEGVAGVASSSGEIEAVTLFAAAQRLRDHIGAPLPPSEQARHEVALSAARERFGEKKYQDVWRKGSGMELEPALALAQKLPLLAQTGT